MSQKQQKGKKITPDLNSKQREFVGKKEKDGRMKSDKKYVQDGKELVKKDVQDGKEIAKKDVQDGKETMGKDEQVAKQQPRKDARNKEENGEGRIKLRAKSKGDSGNMEHQESSGGRVESKAMSKGGSGNTEQQERGEGKVVSKMKSKSNSGSTEQQKSNEGRVESKAKSKGGSDNMEHKSGKGRVRSKAMSKGGSGNTEHQERGEGSVQKKIKSKDDSDNTEQWHSDDHGKMDKRRRDNHVRQEKEIQGSGKPPHQKCPREQQQKREHRSDSFQERNTPVSRFPRGGANITEVYGDLFEAAVDFSLAHCVAEDFRMSAGIAVQFKSLFGSVGKLRDQNVKTGGMAFLEDKECANRYIIYLVTKRMSHLKPSRESIKNSIQAMAEFCAERGICKLAIPKIGCGLDMLDWDYVKGLLQMWMPSNMEIVVYKLVQRKFRTKK